VVLVAEKNGRLDREAYDVRKYCAAEKDHVTPSRRVFDADFEFLVMKKGYVY
jgi:hypothetical protein